MNNENMLPVGTMLRGGTYKITKQLSSGGFGNTYMVQNVSFNETYAMKEFFMRGVNLREGDTVTVSVPDNKATFESQKAKLKKEAQRLRRLHNAHIVQVHDLFEERGTIYYVMDYIDGESLGSRLQRTGKPLTEAEAMDVLRQMLDALELVHSQSPQLLHLDIKPANIMVDGSGCAYLIDFGASKQIATDDNNALSTTTGMSYTAGYAPSEQIEQNYERMGPWTDFYALGATLYKLVTMQQPPSPSDISDDGTDAFHFPASVSASCRKLICWMMTPSRKKRPQSVAEIQAFVKEHFKESTSASSRQQDTSEKEETKKAATIEVKQEEKTEYEKEPDAKEETEFEEKEPDAKEETEFEEKEPDAKEETEFEEKEPDAKEETEFEEKKKTADKKAVDVPKSTSSSQPKSKSFRWLWGLGPLTVIALVVGLVWNANSGGASQKSESSGTEEKQLKNDEIIQNLVNNMVSVEGGTFTMGATSEQGSDADEREKPAHQVTLSSFSIGKYEVTQEEWEAVMGSNPSSFKGAKRPLENVSWNNCQEFIRKLNQITGKKFRFPTEAEWEYAARGGNQSKHYKYAGSNDIGSVAWYDGSSGLVTHPVGQKQPNELGLYDMSGNVWEWCQDWAESFSSSAQTNPTGPGDGSIRILRGGSWGFDVGRCRVSMRGGCPPNSGSDNFGLRLAL